MKHWLYGLFGMLLLGALWTPQAQAANIITFDDNAQTCGGSVMCSTSTNGTTGYLNNGSGQAFDLSTISQWFQIDPGGVNQLAGQPEAEPDGGAGGFRVVNNTGSAVTSFSLTLTDTFNSSTPSVNFCSGSSGPLCDQFQANEGTAAGGSATESLSGTDLYSCSTGAITSNSCPSSGNNAVAEFEPSQITYTWNGLNIASGDYFDITFASWQSAGVNSNNAFEVGEQSPVPEPTSIVLLGSLLLITSRTLRKKKAIRS